MLVVMIYLQWELVSRCPLLDLKFGLIAVDKGELGVFGAPVLHVMTTYTKIVAGPKRGEFGSTATSGAGL
jgi:hypothetical protein